MTQNKTTLKMLWVSHVVPYPPKGGLLMRSHYLSTSLTERFDIDLVALVQKKPLVSIFGDVDKGLSEAIEALSNKFGNIDFVSMDSNESQLSKYALAIKSIFSSYPYSMSIFQSKELEDCLRKRLSENDYDLVHFDTISLAPYIKFSHANINILDHHNIESHMMLRRSSKEKNLFKKLYYFQEGKRLLYFEKKYLPQFTAHITCSELDSDRLTVISSSVVTKTIPNPVRANDKLVRALDNGCFNMLFVGGLRWYPNADAMIHFCEDIYDHCKLQNVKHRFDIVGTNPPKRLRDICSDKPYIKIHGFVDSIEDFYKSCHLYICPIRDGGGTKLKVVDAMGSGLAVIGYPETFEGLDVIDGESAIICRDREELIERIKDCVSGRYDLIKMGEAARNLVLNNYDIKPVGDLLCDYYQNICTRDLA